jgi:hypothetical protein
MAADTLFVIREAVRKVFGLAHVLAEGAGGRPFVLFFHDRELSRQEPAIRVRRLPMCLGTHFRL